MPDVIAEQGALQDAIESPSTSVSRLGAAGWMKGKVADLNSIGVTENVSRLSAAGRIIGAIYDTDPFATATFYAPLTKSLVLTRGTGDPTFTRATTAYVEDFEGVWREVPSGAARFKGARVVRNLLRAASSVPLDSSNDLTGADSGGSPTIGTNSVTVTAGSGTFVRWEKAQSGMPTSIGKVYSFRFTVTGNAAAIGKTFTMESGATGDVGAGTRAAFVIDGSAQTFRLLRSVTLTTNGLVNYWDLNHTNGNMPIGAILTFSNFQIEDVTGQTNQNPSEYVSVGVLSAPYHGAGVDGVKYFDTENGNSVASNVVTEATGAAIPDATLKGYFAEGQRQNRCLYSQDFTNAAWVSGGGGIAVTPNSTTAPDGTTTADTLTASGANGTLIQDLGVVASAEKAGGLYLKRKTGTGNIDLTLDGGSTWTTVAVTSSWLLLEKTQTLANEDFGIRIVTSGDAVYAWQAQVETAAFISSPIPTTTAAVTRNGDVLTYPSAGNVLGTVGTIYMEWNKISNPSDGGWLINVRNDGPGPYAGSSNSGLTNYDGTTTATGPAGTPSESLKKGAVSYQAVQQVVINGVLGTPAAFDGDLGVEATLGVACRNGGAGQLFGNLRNVRIWNKALPEATLESITTP